MRGAGAKRRAYNTNDDTRNACQQPRKSMQCVLSVYLKWWSWRTAPPRRRRLRRRPRRRPRAASARRRPSSAFPAATTVTPCVLSSSGLQDDGHNTTQHTQEGVPVISSAKSPSFRPALTCAARSSDGSPAGCSHPSSVRKRRTCGEKGKRRTWGRRSLHAARLRARHLLAIETQAGRSPTPNPTTTRIHPRISAPPRPPAPSPARAARAPPRPAASTPRPPRGRSPCRASRTGSCCAMIGW